MEIFNWLINCFCKTLTWLFWSARYRTTIGSKYLEKAYGMEGLFSWQNIAIWGTCSISSARTVGSVRVKIKQNKKGTINVSKHTVRHCENKLFYTLVLTNCVLKWSSQYVYSELPFDKHHLYAKPSASTLYTNKLLRKTWPTFPIIKRKNKKTHNNCKRASHQTLWVPGSIQIPYTHHLLPWKLLCRKWIQLQWEGTNWG